MNKLKDGVELKTTGIAYKSSSKVELNKIIDTLHYAYKQGALHLSNHTNTEHFFGFCFQVFRQAKAQ